MDVKTRGEAPSDAERAAVASVLGPALARNLHEGFGGHSRREQRHLLLPILHAVNDRVGWLSQAAIDHIAERLDIGPAEVYGVASFYALFSMVERSTHQVHVCIDLVCRAHGGPTDEDLPDGTHPSPCLGLCERAPAALVIDAGDPVRQAVAGNGGGTAALAEMGSGDRRGVVSVAIRDGVRRADPQPLVDLVGIAAMPRSGATRTEQPTALMRSRRISRSASACLQ